MSLHVNLLPESYQRIRRRERRFRLGLLAGALLLGAELSGAVVLYLRANETRVMLSRSAAARVAAQDLYSEMEQPKRQAERLGEQVKLAERLRTKHRWSRLLGMLAEATPERVVFTSVATDPPQWTPSLRQASSGGRTGTAAVRRVIEGITINGYAADHDDLSAFMAALHESQKFANLDLRQARRDRHLGRDAILFELQCRW